MKKLIILGTADNRVDAPFDEDVVIWGTGGCVNAPGVKRVDAVFEIHPERYWKDPQVTKLLREFPGTVYMQDHYEEIPNSVRYPIEKVKEAFYSPTMGETLYVTNTVSFMLAFAYIEGYTDIETYGVWMDHETEYDYQRTNCEYYLGFLHAKGIDVVLHGGSVLKAQFLYGFEEPAFIGTLVNDGTGLNNSMETIKKELEEKQRAVWLQEGAIRYNRDLRKKYGGY